MALYHLIYRSRAVARFDDQTLAALLEDCRNNNTPKKITGILLFGYGYFMQMLEGDKDVVCSLFHDNIARDERHTDVTVLREGHISTRLFSRWAMAYRPMDTELLQHAEGYVNPALHSEYGRDLLSPLRTYQAMEMLSVNMGVK